MARTGSKLLNRYCRNLPVGRLEWIGLRRSHRGTMAVVSEAEAIVDGGLRGDHRLEKTPGSARQVTLISREFIQQAAHFLGRDTLDPRLLRRNLVISGINLHLVRYQQLQIGDVILACSALCHPCSRMEQNLGPGGFAAMYGHGGLCAKVMVGGMVTVGTEVKVITSEQ